MTTLAEQMQSLTESHLRGEISQIELLAEQRKLLGQDLTPTAPAPADAPQPPALSTETKATAVISRFEAKMADTAARLAETREKAAVIELEKGRIAGAIAAAESKQRIVSGNGSVYKREKADLIARGLLGESVDLTSVQSQAEDFTDRVSASDLALGLQALRGQLAEIERRRVGIEADRRRLTHEYCESYGGAASVRFMLLAHEMAEEYCKIRAAHSVSQQNGNAFCTIAPESLSLLTIHNPMDYPLMQESGLGRREINGRVLEESNAVRNAAAALINDMTGV